MALRPCGAGVGGAGLQFRSTMGGSGVSPQWGWWTGGCFFPTQGLLRAVLLHPGLWRGARFGEGLLVQRCPRGPAQGKPGFTALPERGKNTPGSFHLPRCLSSGNPHVPAALSCGSGASDLPPPRPLLAPGHGHVSHLGYNYPDAFLGGHRSFPERRQAVRGDECVARHSTACHAAIQDMARTMPGCKACGLSEDTRHHANTASNT